MTRLARRVGAFVVISSALALQACGPTLVESDATIKSINSKFPGIEVSEAELRLNAKGSWFTTDLPLPSDLSDGKVRFYPRTDPVDIFVPPYISGSFWGYVYKEDFESELVPINGVLTLPTNTRYIGRFWYQDDPASAKQGYWTRGGIVRFDGIVEQADLEGQQYEAAYEKRHFNSNFWGEVTDDSLPGGRLRRDSPGYRSERYTYERATGDELKTTVHIEDKLALPLAGLGDWQENSTQTYDYISLMVADNRSPKWSLPDQPDGDGFATNLPKELAQASVLFAEHLGKLVQKKRKIGRDPEIRAVPGFYFVSSETKPTRLIYIRQGTSNLDDVVSLITIPDIVARMREGFGNGCLGLPSDQALVLRGNCDPNNFELPITVYLPSEGEIQYWEKDTRMVRHTLPKNLNFNSEIKTTVVNSDDPIFAFASLTGGQTGNDGGLTLVASASAETQRKQAARDRIENSTCAKTARRAENAAGLFNKRRDMDYFEESLEFRIKGINGYPYANRTQGYDPFGNRNPLDSWQDFLEEFMPKELFRFEKSHKELEESLNYFLGENDFSRCPDWAFTKAEKALDRLPFAGAVVAERKAIFEALEDEYTPFFRQQAEVAKRGQRQLARAQAAQTRAIYRSIITGLQQSTQNTLNQLEANNRALRRTFQQAQAAQQRTQVTRTQTGSGDSSSAKLAAAQQRQAEQREALIRRQAQAAEQRQAAATQARQRAQQHQAGPAPSSSGDKTVALEALSYCWANDKGFWFCDGPVQNTRFGKKDRSEALKESGCERSRREQPFQKGVLVYCGFNLKEGPTGKLTWNRDIRQWYTIDTGGG